MISTWSKTLLEPDDPDDPDDPDEPVDPIDPVDPVEPVEPIEPVEPDEPTPAENAVPAKATWADIIRASKKDAKLTFDCTHMTATSYEICGDWATALAERPDVTVTFKFMDNGVKVSMTIEPGTDLLGAMKEAGLRETDRISFQKIAELAGVDFTAIETAAA